MANWITHTVIADKILDMGLKADRTGFVVGNIAPDCNVENEDWTDFTPSRETTHFMSEEKNKATIDCEEFYDRYIKGKRFDNDEHYAFLLGYYSHLIIDKEYLLNFVRSEKRVKSAFERIKKIESMRKQIDGYPENFDTLKTVFGHNVIFDDMANLEHRYLHSDPDASYSTVLRKISEFSDYLDFLPSGAIARKIRIMAYEPPEKTDDSPLVFFSENEYLQFLSDTSNYIYNKIKSH